jgi:hypothetical protein
MLDITVVLTLFMGIAVTTLVLSKSANIRDRVFKHSTHLVVSIITTVISVVWIFANAFACKQHMRLLILLPITLFYVFFFLYKHYQHTDSPVHTNTVNAATSIPVGSGPVGGPVGGP